MIYICTGDNKVGMVGTRTNVGYTEDDEEPDFYWNDDLKNGTGNGNNTDKVNDGEDSHDE